MEGDRREDGKVDRFRQRLQDAQRHVHGIRLVGVQTVVGEGLGLSRVEGDAVLDDAQYALVEF